MHRSSTVRYTYADYLSIPESHDRHEIIDGELFVTPTPRVNHQIVEPDVVFVHRDRLDRVEPEGHVHGPPDVIVEVLSPSTRDYDRSLKRKRCLEVGVGQVWIVDIDARSIEVWRPGSTEPEVSTDALSWSVGGATFRMPLAEVFRSVR